MRGAPMRILLKKMEPVIKDWKQDQRNCEWAGRLSPCCFGARIAGMLGLRRKRKGDSVYVGYKGGMIWFYDEAKKIGWSAEQVDKTMWACGAQLNPFGVLDWPLPPKKVFENLIKYEFPISEGTFNFYHLKGNRPESHPMY